MGYRVFFYSLKTNARALFDHSDISFSPHNFVKCLAYASRNDEPARFVLKRTLTIIHFQRQYFSSSSYKQFSENSYTRKSISTNVFSESTPKMSAFTDDVQELQLPRLGSDQDIKTSPELREAVDICSTCLLNGGVIAVPTDTIYGIAGLSQKIDAVNRIYDIKHRNYQNPVAISVGDVDDIYRWGKVTVPRDLLTDLLPGPVTVVFERSPELNPSLNPHTSKVGIRIPGNTFMQELAKKCGSPIALTSANISGGRSCLQTQEFQHLWPLLDVVVNGGVLNDTEESRLGSTVVDLSTPGSFRIIRNGSAYSATSKVLQDKYDLKNATSLKAQR